MAKQAAAKIRQIENEADDKAKGTALRLISQTMVRLMRGDTSLRLTVWRQHFEVEEHQKLMEMQRSMDATLATQGKAAALRSLHEILAALVRGELGLRLVVWRSNILEEMRQEEVSCMQRELELQMYETRAGMALRQMKQTLCRLARGEVEMRVSVWRDGMKDSSHSIMVRHFVAMENKLRDQMQCSGVKMIQQSMQRLVKGELGMRLTVWKQWVQGEIVLDDMDILHRSLTAALTDQAADASTGAGLRLVMQIMTRLMKGELGYRVEIWNQKMKMEREAALMENHARLARLKYELELQLRATSQEAGVRVMIQILKGLISGEIWRRLSIWRLQSKDVEAALSLSRLEHNLEAKAADSRSSSGLRLLKQSVTRLLKRELGFRVEIWRQKTKMNQHSALLATQEALERQLTATEKGGGLRLLVCCLRRLARGELSMRVSMWQMQWKDVTREQEMSRLESHMVAKASDKRKGVGIRQMTACLIRIAKGESAMRVKVWQQLMRMDSNADVVAMKARFENHMRVHCKNSAMALMAQYMARRLRGETGVRLQIWRMEWQAHTRRQAMQMLHDSLRSEYMSERKRIAIREIARCLSRVTKGEIGMRIRYWLKGMWIETSMEWAEQYSISATGLADLDEFNKSAACRLLTQVLARQLRGELGLRLLLWRQGLKWDTAATSTGIQGALITMMRSERKKIALRNLQRSLLGISKGAAVFVLQEWRDNKCDGEALNREALFTEAIKYLQNIHEDEMAKLEELHVAKLRERSAFLEEATARLLELEEEYDNRVSTSIGRESEANAAVVQSSQLLRLFREEQAHQASMLREELEEHQSTKSELDTVKRTLAQLLVHHHPTWAAQSGESDVEEGTGSYSVDFDTLDMNKDGVIDQVEFEAMGRAQNLKSHLGTAGLRQSEVPPECQGQGWL